MDAARLVVLDSGSRQITRLVAALASEAGFEVVARGRDLDALFDLSTDAPPDLVLIDADAIHPPDQARRHAISYATQMFPRARVVVLTDRDDMEAIMGAAASGASGILSKRTDPDRLLAAIRNASSGAVVIDREFIERFDARIGSAMARPDAAAQPSPLTPRETEVLTMLSKGMHVSEIGRELGISVHTTRGHVKKILAKVESHSQLEAVVKAAARGWLPGR